MGFGHTQASGTATTVHLSIMQQSEQAVYERVGPGVVVSGLLPSLQEVSAQVLRHLLSRAEKELLGRTSQGSTRTRRHAIREAVITVPAHFGPAQVR
jgi:molecular chaperone DnaK (HSP70)